MTPVRLLLAIAFFCAGASAATYYVDPAGSNANDGLSPQTPWRTLLKVGISTFLPGDSILFKRDGVWNEWLTPPSSGAAGNLIKFDSYGNGRPPEFTGRYATTSAQWTNTSGNVWQITLTATQAISQLTFVQFGSIWGNGQVSQAALAHNRDWYYDGVNQVLYVYSSGGNPVTGYRSITPIILSGQSLININNVSYIEVQHIKLDWYDGYGVQVQGTSDHIWLANILADSQVPNATVPLGFYVHPSGTAGDIHLYNTDAHRNYIGYRFDGTPTAIELKNCRAYANRTYGLMDNTAAVTYSYCHFYANNLATGISTDVTGTPGPIDGGNNLPADTPPNVRGFMQYPARITLTYDDPGLIDGSHQYIQALLPMFQQKSVPLSIAVVTGYPLSQQLVPTFQSWINCRLGRERAFGFAPIFCFSKCVYGAVHGNGRKQRDAYHWEQAVDDQRAWRSRRASQLELEFIRNRHCSDWIRYAGRTGFHVESARRFFCEHRSEHEERGKKRRSSRCRFAGHHGRPVHLADGQDAAHD